MVQFNFDLNMQVLMYQRVLIKPKEN